MSDSLIRWQEDAAHYGWVMPRAEWWKRLPVIRHFRVVYLSLAVDRHERFYSAMGMAPLGYDRWVLFGIWHGMDGRK